jgi:hypothetical protein
VNLLWVRANADGVLINHGGYLHCARLVGIVTGNTEISVVLRDGLTAAGPVIMAMDMINGRPDDWPPLPVSMRFMTGLYAVFTGGTAPARLLVVGWQDNAQGEG